MNNRKTFSAISLFSGAGGMDVGFAAAGFVSKMVCEIDNDACQTLNKNLSSIGHKSNLIYPTDIMDLDLGGLPKNVDVIFGGPPCQGFSVAGKMNPNDNRSQLIFKFLECVNAAQPVGFVCENVKALAVSKRWKDVRTALKKEIAADYTATIVLLNSSHYGVPQARERMFLIGLRKDIFDGTSQQLYTTLIENLSKYQRQPEAIGKLIQKFGKAGTEKNPKTCVAKITYAKNPVLRRSPYAGMLFNGAGRPLPVFGYSCTLPASMGGNKTPIIDEEEIFNSAESFVEEYHTKLRSGTKPKTGEAPSRLRRLTINECKAIQTFPDHYDFSGGKSSVYRQIGNAVPCNLAHAVALAYLRAWSS